MVLWDIEEEERAGDEKWMEDDKREKGTWVNMDEIMQEESIVL